MPRLPHLLLPALLLAALPGLTSCDSADEGGNDAVEVRDVAVELDRSLGNLHVGPNTVNFVSKTMELDLGFKRVEAIREIEINPAFVSFTSDVAKNGAVQGSGTINLALAINRVPLPRAIVITITDDVVTRVEPSRITVDGNLVFDKPGLRSVLAAFPPGQDPDLQDWENMSLQELLDEISEGLERPRSPFTVAFTTRGDASGTLSISQFTFDALVVEGE